MATDVARRRQQSVVLLSIATATNAFAGDDGNTQPKLTQGGVGGGISSPQDIIGTTNGTGNVKGVQCSSPSSGNLGSTSISFYVNGGSAQTLNLANTQVLLDSASNYYISFIPMNVRFTSSIRSAIGRTSVGSVRQLHRQLGTGLR